MSEEKMRSDKAIRALRHIAYRMQADGRLAYLIGEGSQSFDLLTEAIAEADGKDVEQFRRAFGASLHYEPWEIA